MEHATMARKKPMGRPKKPTTSELTTRAFRTTDKYAAWLDELAVFNRSSVAGLFDQALAHYAREIGFTKGPPPRT